MFIGLPNPNVIMPLEKMSITPVNSKMKKFYVLYNPERYTQSREAHYAEAPGFSTNVPISQFSRGSLENLTFTLFFDTMSSGAEVGGTKVEKIKLAANSLLPSAAKTDVREYTKKVYNLMMVDPSLHAPPLLKLEWSTLQFEGHLISCKQSFIKFNERGNPVRAWLECQFQQFVAPSKIATMKPNESPDTTKYRVIHQGDALWAFASREYGQAEHWREIAAANRINNPRLLRSGETVVLPALE